ncbi:hypothetical protein ETC05_01025 [Geobacillus sp. BMUD]|nr:hypothetical protein [Geobacillus sp. BMUD]
MADIERQAVRKQDSLFDCLQTRVLMIHYFTKKQRIIWLNTSVSASFLEQEHRRENGVCP